MPEQAFKGMDTVIAEAARNNVKLVIALMNNWNYNPLQTDWKCASQTTSQNFVLSQHFIASTAVLVPHVPTLPDLFQAT